VADDKAQDVFLFIVSDAGQLIRGHQVSYNPSDKNFLADVKLGLNALRKIGNQYAFAGSAVGFGTIYQTEQFTDAKANSFVMKLLLDKNTNH
jgi:hypothetical protein